MTTQLSLIEVPRRPPGTRRRPPSSVWQLDERTREVGRRGIARARATLQAARARDLTDQVAGAGTVGSADAA